MFTKIKNGIVNAGRKVADVAKKAYHVVMGNPGTAGGAGAGGAVVTYCLIKSNEVMAQVTPTAVTPEDIIDWPTTATNMLTYFAAGIGAVMVVALSAFGVRYLWSWFRHSAHG